MSTELRPTPETDAADTIPYMDGDELTWWVKKDFARRLEMERDEAREEAAALRRNPDISICDKGHRFRTIASHPAKSEREWECPHCAVKERDSAKTLNRTLLDQLEAQAVQIEAMRNAIQLHADKPQHRPESLS